MGIILSLCGVLTLCNFYFISGIVQVIYYVVYSVLWIVTLIMLGKQRPLGIHHGILICYNLLFILITIANHFIALPLLLVFPLLWSEKTHRIFKIFSTISYVILVLFMLLILFVRCFFIVTTLVKRVEAPSKRYMVEIYSVDEGALGGVTNVYLANKYFNIIMREKLIRRNGYGSGNEVYWIDNEHISFDGEVISIFENKLE